MSFTPTQKDIEEYETLKADLVRHLRKGKILRSQDCPGHVGLVNQGATCYLNSLIQTLFHIPVFRNYIIKNDSGAKITTALRKLFVSLLLSEDCAISTKDLTTAFGWSNSDVFDQHDIQELFCSMTDALCQESPDIDTFLTENFKGTLIDSLECPSCGYQKQSNASFQDIPLNLTEKISAQGILLIEMLQQFSAIEILDSSNLWKCSNCSQNVAAKKSTQLQSLPTTLFLHLKRFGFDQNTQQRKKINSPIYFPKQVTEAELRNGGSVNTRYSLRSILVHLGTASGGHYKAYIQSKGTWYEYDDAIVTELSKDEENRLLWFTSLNDLETKKNNDNNDFVMKGFSIYEGAYMLVYQVDDAASMEEESLDIKLNIPSELVDEVKVANEQLSTLKRANEVHKLMTELSCFKLTADVGTHVKPHNITLTPITCHLIGLKSYDETLKIVYDSFVRIGVIDSSQVSINMCRLRRYNPSSRMVGETFTGKESNSLVDLGLSPLSSLALEVLSPGGTFADFNPKEVEVRLIEWKNNQLALTDDSVVDVFVNVIGDENANVLGLRNRVAQYFGITDLNRIILAKSDVKSSYIELSEDTYLLSSGYNIRSGDDIIVSVLSEGETRHNGKGLEFTTKLQALKRNITISYNLPDSNIDSILYDQTIKISLDSTLGDLKNCISSVIKQPVNSFFIRRNPNSPQLKKLNKTLEEVGFVDQSVVYVQLGQQISPGEHLIQCELDLTNDDQDWKVTPEKTSIILGDLIVKEKMTVLQLKELVFSQWNKWNVNLSPQSIHHIRIRDGQTGGQSGPLRDNRMLGRSLVGLGDGRKLIFQVLSQPEILSNDSLFISIRIMSFQDKIISRPLGMSLSRNCTVRQLYRTILEKFHSIDESAPPLDSNTSESLIDIYNKFPDSRIISIAKAYNSGPPLTMKSSLKLKWNDETILRESNSTIDKPPFNLRDGSVIVVRNVADFERARDAARARVAERPSSSVGGVSGDSPARGRIRPNSRAKSRSGKREKGITINATENSDSSAPPPPEPSPGKDASLNARHGTGELLRSPRMDIADDTTDVRNGLTLPNAPVRIVKVLRSPRPGEADSNN